MTGIRAPSPSSGAQLPSTVAELLNDKLRTKTPAQIVFFTLTGAIVAKVLADALAPGNVLERAKLSVFRAARVLLEPIIRRKVTEAAQGITFRTQGASEVYHNRFPLTGLPSADVIQLSQQWHRELDSKLDEQLLSGVVYRDAKSDEEMIIKVIQQHIWANPIFADYFGATRKMEAEVAAMVLDLFNPPEASRDDYCATYTFGGTESVLLAMLAYRNYGMKVKGIAVPEVVVPNTVHPAFDKAAEYFQLRLVKAKVDPLTSKAIPSEIEKCIGANTVAIVANAPNFHAGTVDDVEALAALARSHGVGLHVDACYGGFIIQFLKDAGYEQPAIDFRVEGVTSISCDIHKWGGAPKGASVVMFSSRALRKQAVFSEANFPGGLYVTQGLSGSKPGYAIAAAWASILNTGRQNYASTIRDAREATLQFADAVRSIPSLRLLGSPDTTIVAFTSSVFDIYMLQKRMRPKGWLFNPLQFPPGIHLGITLQHTKKGVMSALIADLRSECAALEREYAGKDASNHAALIYGSTQQVPDRSIINDVLCAYVDRFYTNAPQPTAEH